mmetsp:Transcript_35594/g.83205  ORF Transcript_35594/g.83205 Transcript_35594/m.83205 type:complete len:247 (-) Transcript_35594:316-1056(-)|eukprot:CAMPEP_0178459244 /NCGR_PEP_ID=MMETSP0689_2-20121128/48015_1 /TAXON_ID=160604 /ORGANISM="Amphidinium massartii, Strain CS-259" /LENGTH=246 /DNA_ID=CAMNT_0020085685 /DNA_START=92 /DNA_END=832 /DNA_ORIENTATION=-
MFSCSACKPAADPATSTVKVNQALIGGTDSVKEAANEQQKPQGAWERKEQQRRQESERQERERTQQIEALEFEPSEHQKKQLEDLKRQQEEAENRRRIEGVLENLMTSDAAKDESVVEKELAQREEERQRMRLQELRDQADAKRLKTFMQDKGYGEDVNSKRKASFRKYYYPLHDAVAEHDAELVRVLLQAGADPSLKSSSGKTALQRASKWNTNGSLDDVCSILQKAVAPRSQPPMPEVAHVAAH